MSFLGILLDSLASLLNFILQAYMFVIIGRAIISWVSPDPHNPIVRALNNLTEPVLYRVRKALPFTYTSGLDLSPIVVMLAIMFLQNFLVRSIAQLAHNFG
ncbi:MAG: YggT family protein [Desulfobulbaceae bacterium]|jgi:YggT family protein|nr:YggT family protein [Desulfobulbaceae bacterium]